MAYCAVVIMSYEQEEFVPFHVRLGERVWDVQLECSNIYVNDFKWALAIRVFEA